MVVLEMNCKVCGNTSAKNTSVSFFRFPKESSKCRDWADRCDLLGLFETHGPVRFHKSFRICSRHFHPKDVLFDGRKNRLLDSAIPHLSAIPKNPSTGENANKFNLPLPQNLCRLCAEEDDNATDIFGRRGRLLHLETKLKYFPQVINKHDILPLKICNQCVSKVNQFYDFILNCTRAETKLRAMLHTRVCNPSPQLADSDQKAHWDSAMGGPSNQTPKLDTSFPDTMPPNRHDQPLMDSFTGDDTAPGSPKNFTSDHDYSNVMSADGLPPPADRTSMEDINFICPLRQDSSAYSAARAHSPPTEWMNDFYDGIVCSRPCQSRRESKTKTRLKRLRGPEENPGESCRCGEKFSQRRVRPPRDETHSEDSHQCTECGKFFRSRASLRQHGSVHSEKRLHKCRECGMSFKRKDTLSNHLRIHTGERPFMCKVCGFAFKQRGDCVKHENNHSFDEEGALGEESESC